MTRRVMRRQKENGLISEEYLRMQVKRRMWNLLGSSMQLREDMGLNLRSSRIQAMVGNL